MAKIAGLGHRWIWLVGLYGVSAFVLSVGCMFVLPEPYAYQLFLLLTRVYATAYELAALSGWLVVAGGCVSAGVFFAPGGTTTAFWACVGGANVANWIIGRSVLGWSTYVSVGSILLVIAWFQWSAGEHVVTWQHNDNRVNLVQHMRDQFKKFSQENVVRVDDRNGHGYLAGCRKLAERLAVDYLIPKDVKFREPGASIRRHVRLDRDRKHICRSVHENKDNERMYSGHPDNDSPGEYENCGLPGEHCPKRMDLPWCLLSHVSYYLSADQLCRIATGPTILLFHSEESKEYGPVGNSEGTMSRRGGENVLTVREGQAYVNPYMCFNIHEGNTEGSIVSREGALWWTFIGNVGDIRVVYCYPHHGRWDARDERNTDRPKPVFKEANHEIYVRRNDKSDKHEWRVYFGTKQGNLGGYQQSDMGLDEFSELCSATIGIGFKERSTDSFRRSIQSFIRRQRIGNFVNYECLTAYLVKQANEDNIFALQDTGVLQDDTGMALMYLRSRIVYHVKERLRFDFGEWAARELLLLRSPLLQVEVNPIQLSDWLLVPYHFLLLVFCWRMWSIRRIDYVAQDGWREHRNGPYWPRDDKQGRYELDGNLILVRPPEEPAVVEASAPPVPAPQEVSEVGQLANDPEVADFTRCSNKKHRNGEPLWVVTVHQYDNKTVVVSSETFPGVYYRKLERELTEEDVSKLDLPDIMESKTYRLATQAWMKALRD